MVHHVFIIGKWVLPKSFYGTTFFGFSPIATHILLGKLYDMMGTYMWTFLLSGPEATFAGLILITTAYSIIKDVPKNEKNRNSSN